MFFDRFKKLCDGRGISVYRACTDIGLNRSAVAKWKNGGQPNGSTAAKLAEYFDVSLDYLLSLDDETIAIERANAAMKNKSFDGIPIGNEGDCLLSGVRLRYLFEAADIDVDIFAYNQSIDPYILSEWINLGDIPPFIDIIDKVLNFFQLKPSDIFSTFELNWYNSAKKSMAYEHSTKYEFNANKENIIKLWGRDGSYLERKLSDDQISALKLFLAVLPDPTQNQ